MAELYMLPYLVPCAVIAVAAYWLISAIYSIYFHPLAHFPGPKINAVSTVPKIFWRVRGEPLRYSHRLHKKYGLHVRIAPNEISTISPSAFKEVYGHRLDGHGNLPKAIKTFYQVDPLNNGSQSMFAADDETHTRQRRIFAHAFSDKAIREQEPLLKHYTDLCVSKLRESTVDGRPVDVVRFYNFTAFDFIADCVFGEPLQLLQQMDYNSWVMRIIKGIKFGSILDAFRAFPFVPAMVKLFLSNSLEKARKQHFKFCTDRVDQRLARGAIDHPDFWTLVEKAEEKDKGLSLPEMHTMSFLLMTAGTETTATLLSGLTYYLCRNPDKMKNLTHEIRTTFKSPDEMTTVTLPQLTYLGWCIDEALRLYPPVPIGPPRYVSSGGAEIDGLPLPPGAIIYFPTWAGYHSENNFARPAEFVPERWDTPPPEEFKHDRKDAFNPFSSGPRGCIGKNLAYHEIRQVIAAVLWHFDVELCPQSNNWTDQKVFTLWEKGPLWVKLHPVAGNVHTS